MDPLSFLANLLLSVTVGTLVVALVAYFAYALRERRRPSRKKIALPVDHPGPIFLRPYSPPPDRTPADAKVVPRAAETEQV